MSSHRRTSKPLEAPHGHRAPRKPRLRMVLAGATVIAVAGGGTAFACMGGPGGGHIADGGHHHHSAVPVTLRSAPPQTTAAPTHAPHHHKPRPRPSTAAPTASAPTTTASPRPTRSSAPPTATPTPAPSTTASDDPARQVLDLINSARAAQGLPAYAVLDGLTRSATDHNQLMASGCGLSHQCPGEPPIGDRETADGVHWSSAGENIGVGGPVADTPQAIAKMALGLTQSMLDEKPPNDGHRQNILSSGFRYIGIAVHRDSSGSVWLTQDFAQLM